MPTREELAAQHCRPRKGPEHRLERRAIEQVLESLPGWSLLDDGGALAKEYRFDDYYRTMAFVNALAFVAHREDHHPDLEVGYDRCRVQYSTHDVGGVSHNDLVCAAKAERLASGDA